MNDFCDILTCLFTQQRTQILTSTDESGRRFFSNSYVYAWSNSVYPWLHESNSYGSESHSTHSGFESCFNINKKTVSSVLSYIDDMVNEGKSLTFDEIDEKFPSVDSLSIIKILRYGFLQGFNTSKEDGAWSEMMSGRYRSGLKSVMIDGLRECDVILE